MIKKCLQDETGDRLEGLTAIGNTPIGEGMPSASALLQGRLLRDSHPVNTLKYQVKAYDLGMVRDQLGIRKSIDRYYHDQHVKSENLH